MLRSLTWITLFSIGMAFLESAVVIYLREIYYPDGFAFPLKEMAPELAVTELLREAATMLMLVSVAAIASKRFSVALSWFLYSFAVWDIFYYLFLFLIIGWPESLMTWDILFLIPVMWTGPVLAPVINSLTMILLALVIIHASRNHVKTALTRLEWILLITGSFITIIAYTQDYMRYMMDRFSFLELVSFRNYQDILAFSSGYIPQSFNWLPFILGEVMFLVAVIIYYRRFHRLHKAS